MSGIRRDGAALSVALLVCGAIVLSPFAVQAQLEGAAAEVARGWAGFFEGPDAPFSWYPDLVEVLESGRLALSSGPVIGASGEEVGRFNSIWRKDPDGQWRVVFDKGS